MTSLSQILLNASSALTLLVRRQEGHPACKKTERWGAGVVICLERGADLHMAQLMPLPLIVSCFSKIQIGFAFLVLAHPGSPGQRAVKRVCVCVCASSANVFKERLHTVRNNKMDLLIDVAGGATLHQPTANCFITLQQILS